MLPNLQLKKVAIKEGAVRVYKKECVIGSVENVREVRLVLSSLPENLKSDEDHMEVERAVHAIVQKSSSVALPTIRKMYTTHEAKTDMFQIVTKQKKLGHSVVPTATMKRHLKDLKAILGKNEWSKDDYLTWVETNSDIVLTAIQQFTFPQSGPQPLLQQVDTEAAVVVA